MALRIVSLALVTGLQAAGALTHKAQRQSELLLAQVCADNELVRLRLSRNMPGVGEASVTCEQAGQTLLVGLAVRPTPNPDFLRAQASVSNERGTVLQVTTVVGRY